MMKNKRVSFAFGLFSARIILLFIIAGTFAEIVLVATANMGAVWNGAIRIFLLEIIFVLLILLSIGTFVVNILNRRIMKPYHELLNAIDEVSKGNFDVSIHYPHNDKFAEVVNCFNQMVIELNGIKTMRNDFMNIFSHECKTPITSIRGFAKQLKRTDLSDEEKEEYLDIIISESDRLTHLHQNILDLCRYQNQEFMTNQEEFSLDEQIRKCILVLEKNWSKKNLDLDIELECLDYYGNEEMLSQVWINILSNAIKFSHSGGKITIQCKRVGEDAVVSIKDEGIGMDEGTKALMFHKYYSASTSLKEGNGIGLAVVKRIIELCQGNIEVDSTQGVGTEVIVTVPIRDGELSNIF